MKSASSTYKMVRALGTGWYEWRVNQGVNTYELDRLKSVDVSFALAGGSGIGIGNANSSECKITLLEESVNWPRMADFTLQFRICTDDSVTKSEWITLGKYYTDERSEDKFGNLSIIAFDAMLMMEQSWTDKIPEQLLPASWPITSKAWATMIQAAGLAAFADLTQLDDTLAFVGLDTTTSIRDVLKTIATVHAGNWVMTVGETLNLIQFENVTQEQTEKYSNLQQKVQAIEDSPALEPVTGIHLETSEGTIMESGDDDGYVVKSICDVADTDGIAAFCLSKIEDYVFKPFRANVAYLDPIVEIGDSVSIDNVIYQIMSLNWNVQKIPTANVSAPYDQEIDHEYQVVNRDAKNYRKTISAINNKLEDYLPWNEVSTAIEQNAESVVIAASGTYVTQTTFNDEIASIQSQLDGNIQSWSGNVVPTLNNAPAVDWTSTALKNEHVGDMYFINSDAGIPEAGNYYRFENNNGVYSWQLITDSISTEALARASAALAAAEQAQDDAEAASEEAQLKGRIFVVQPTPPYSVGDLWFNDDQSVIKVCMTARETGSFVSTDWVKRDKYTDDSTFLAFQTAYNETISAIQEQLDKKAETYYQATDPSMEWLARPVGVAIAGIDVVGIPELIALSHEGDLWYRTTDNTTWFWDGEKWVQQEVPDDVFDKIDGKAQIFIEEPYPPYNVGDLWFNSANSDIMTCTVARATGDFNQGDWEKRNKYTDDTAANDVAQQLTTFESSFSVEPSQINAEITKRVIKDHSETKTTFGWEMTDTYHKWYADNSEVVRINADGVFVKGEIRATTGYIGNDSYGFEINATNFHNGMTSLSDTTHNGVYVGTDGIALGQGKFKVTSSGAVTASNLAITGGSIKLGGTDSAPVFSVTSSGAVTASNLTITGGSISINNGAFRVDSNGNLTANNGTFGGNVYAKNIQYGGDAGTYSGAGVTPGTIYGGGASGQIAQNTLGDYNVAKYGGAGAYTPASFSSGVQGSLYNADMFGYATRRGSAQYPEYFCATSITALSTMYANDFYIELGGDTQLGLKTHYHTVVVSQDGTVQFGQPTNTRPDPFNIADTHFFEDYVSAIDVSSLTRTYPDGESSYPYYDSETLGKIIEFKVQYQISDGDGTVLTGGSQLMTVPAGAAYDAGHNDGERGVSVTAIQYYTVSGEETVTYNSTNKTLNASVQATLTNGNTNGSIRTVTIPAVLAYNAGLGDGADTVTVTSITRTYPDGESSYPYYDSATLGKVIEFKAITTMSNGHSGSQTLTVPATSAYNAGYEAGSQGGSGSVTIESVGRDTSQSTTYDSSTKLYTIPILATASNGATKTSTVQQSGAAAYLAGQTDAEAGITVSVTAEQNEWNSSTHKKVITVTADVKNSSETTIKTNTSLIQVDATEVFDSVSATVSMNGTQSGSQANRGFIAAAANLTNGRTFTGAYYFYLNETENTSTAVTMQVTDSNSNVLATKTITPQGSDVHVTAMQYYTVSGEETISYDSANNTLSASVQATLSNGNTNGSIRTVTFPADLAYNAGSTAGAQAVTVTAIGLNTDWETSSTGYIYETANNRYAVRARATLSTARRFSSTLYVPAIDAYNAGASSVTASATGLTTDSSSYGTYDQAIGLGASSVYAVSGTQYGRIRVSLSNGTTRTIRVGMPYNTPATVSSVGDNGTYWNSTYKMYLVQAAATMSDGTTGGTGSWYLNPTEAINFGKSQASGYTNVYSGADLVAWYQSGGDVTGVKVRVYVYGTPAGGSSAQLIRYDDVTFNRY